MSDAAPESETLESLQTRHRKEQRDLVARTTQKKKQASKKTRKGVNDECERLERELKERQEHELAALNGDVAEDIEPSEDEAASPQASPTIEPSLATLQINATEPNTPDDSSTPRAKKPNRAKARLARRAADQDAAIRAAELEAANAPNPREIEREAMATQLATRNLALHEIRADGHCLYAAVADQLQSRELGLEPRIKVAVEGQAYKKVRHAAAGWIEAHREDFEGFMEDGLGEHVRKIRETGEWGGHLELLALARTYGVSICVLHSDGRVDRIDAEGEGAGEEIWLGYYRHSHGLGEHYNSLRKAS
jgi:OTU domain-containing protein 6